MDHKAILSSIEKKQFHPIYLFHGEEPFFIDVLSEAIVKNALEDHERDFNQTIVYGKDCVPIEVVGLSKQFPMMSERSLVVIREAQDIKKWEDFEDYFANPQPSTILVICHKHKKMDARSKAFKALAKTGIVFQSDKVKDYQLVTWIMAYVKEHGFDITDKAANLLAEFLGNDLTKIMNELEKLSILLEKGTRINDVHIEENIGISKDYNVFELVNAIGEKDILKANKIVAYFGQNPKAAHPTVIISNLFTLFSRLMEVHFLPVKTPDAVAAHQKVHPFVAKETLRQSRLHNPKKIAKNIGILKQYDLKSKGVGGYSNVSEGDLLKELVFLLLHDS
jgi:DNA polymerase-3 subunit delta